MFQSSINGINISQLKQIIDCLGYDISDSMLQLLFIDMVEPLDTDHISEEQFSIYLLIIYRIMD